MNASDLMERYHIWPQDLTDPRALNVVQIERIDGEYYAATENGQQVQKYRNLLRLKGYRVPLRLNNTRLQVLIGLLGEDTDKWTGRRIGLYIAANNNFGKLEPTIFIHLESCDHVEPAVPIERVAVRALPQQRAGPQAGFTGEIQRAMSRFQPSPPKGPTAGAAPAPPPPPGAPPVSTAFDVRPIGEKNAAAFRAAMAEQGIGLDDVVAWFKRHDEQTHERVWGQELQDWPRGVGPAMQKCLRMYPEEANRAAPPASPSPLQPSAPANASATPSGSSPAAAPVPGAAPAFTPSMSVKPGATYGQPAPDEDIPF